ncbi:hypothetical protein MTO96_010382 [Rhipicephalus appendiculatus]
MLAMGFAAEAAYKGATPASRASRKGTSSAREGTHGTTSLPKDGTSGLPYAGLGGRDQRLFHNKLPSWRQAVFRTVSRPDVHALFKVTLGAINRTSLPPLASVPRCGPGGRGVCYSADVCCTSSACVINDPLLALPCRAESLHSHACQVPGKRCGAVAQGRCAMRGFCCGADGCRRDESCSNDASTDQFGTSVDMLEYGVSRR